MFFSNAIARQVVRLAFFIQDATTPGYSYVFYCLSADWNKCLHAQLFTYRARTTSLLYHHSFDILVAACLYLVVVHAW